MLGEAVVNLRPATLLFRQVLMVSGIGLRIPDVGF